MESWQINLSLIPSIALLLMSANNLAIGLANEINNHFANAQHNPDRIFYQKKIQLKRLSMAIFLMYTSLSVLIANALLVAIEIIPRQYEKSMMLLAILILFFAIYFKLAFSFKAYFIRTHQYEIDPPKAEN